MNENFDDILTATQENKRPQAQQTRLEPYDKAAYKEKKQNERENCYRLADLTLERMAASAEVYTAYLNVQARFNRYSVTNALLLTAQCPNAAQLATFEDWQKAGVRIEKSSKAIFLLEPGKEYEREDGSIGASFNVKKVFDISQTNAAPHQTEIHRDQRLLIKALLHNAPCTLAFDDDLPATVEAQYKLENKTLYVRHGLNGDDMFRALARELAFANLDKGDEFSRIENTFRAKSIAYLVCVRNYISPEAVIIPSSYSNQEPKALKQALQEIREIANTMHSSMEQVLSKQHREQALQQNKNSRSGNAR